MATTQAANRANISAASQWQSLGRYPSAARDHSRRGPVALACVAARAAEMVVEGRPHSSLHWQAPGEGLAASYQCHTRVSGHGCSVKLRRRSEREPVGVAAADSTHYPCHWQQPQRQSCTHRDPCPTWEGSQPQQRRGPRPLRAAPPRVLVAGPYPDLQCHRLCLPCRWHWAASEPPHAHPRHWRQARGPGRPLRQGHAAHLQPCPGRVPVVQAHFWQQ